MLQAIRDRATGWIAYIIIGLLIIPFALWGVNQYFGDPAPLAAAQVNETPISLREFQQAYQLQRQRLQNLLGDSYDPSLIDEARLKREVLDRLIEERVLAQAAHRHGFRIGDQQLSAVLLANEAFRQEGRFDRERYERLLAAQGYSPAGFEEGLRRSLATEQWRQGIVASSIVTPAEIQGLVSLLTQKRELSYLVFPLEKYLNQVSVDETAVEAYYQEHQDRFMSPEQVRLRYLELTPAKVAAEIPVDEEELEAAFTAYQQRAAVYMQAKTQAEAIREAIVSGEKTFEEALEKAVAADDREGGKLGAIGRGMMEPAFESALYGLENVGDISEPVKTSFGLHIIRFDGVTPAGEREASHILVPLPEDVVKADIDPTKSEAEVREELAHQIRMRQAETRFYDLIETLYNLSFEHPDTLEPAAEALGLEVAETDWLTRERGEGIAALPKVREAAFSEEVLRRGLNSEPLEIEPERVVVIRLLDHREAQPLSLSEARDDIAEQLRRQRAEEAMRADGETIQKRFTDGEALEALAEEFGGELKTAGPVARTDSAVSSAILAEAFRLPKPEENQPSVGTAALPTGDLAVIAVERIVPGKIEDLPEAERTALLQRLETQKGASQFDALADSLRQQAEVVVYSERL